MQANRKAKSGAAGLVHRLLPGREAEFTFATLPATGNDTFDIDAANGQVTIGGTSERARSAGLYRYLGDVAHGGVFWDATQLNLPHPLPATEPIRGTSPHTHRFYFNPCTFSYSMPFWDWLRWEREIDWMALHGITMPLAMTGQEAVWQNVYRSLGLTEDEIAAFFVGPAYLPFGWMGCMDGWGGPLSQHWIDAHRDLQQQIVTRERDLGMTPVLQGFTGHVPAGLARVAPESTLHRLRWLDFPETWYLDPLDPLFAEIGSRFIAEQTRLYGTDHLYLADPFIEMEPTRNDPEFLTDVGRGIYAGMATADPEATWIMQGWAFHYKRNFWQPPQVKALLDAVPNDRMLMLDLWAEEHPVWQETESFYGKPWLWCMLHNFGGRPGMCGRMPLVASAPALALTDPDRGALCGIGMAPEAIEQNPALYELMAEMAWHDAPIDLPTWITTYAQRRYGSTNPDAAHAWQLIAESVYAWRGNGFDATFSIIGMRPMHTRLGQPATTETPFDHKRFQEAWSRLLAAADELGESATYRRDLVDVTQQALSTVASALHAEMLAAIAEGTAGAFASVSTRFLDLISDLDALVGTQSAYLLGGWIASARAWGETESERTLLEWNARCQVTLWSTPGSELNDYSRRHWSGLISHFYLPRWQRWIAATSASLTTGEPLDVETLTAELLAWEEAWTHDTSPFPVEPTGDAIAIARDLFARYATNLG